MKHANHFYSIIIVSLVLILFGLISIGVLQTNSLTKYFKEQVNIVVELKSDATQADIEKVEEKIAESQVVKQGSTQFISKEKGVEMLEEEFGADLKSLQLTNPLHDIVTFNLKARYISTEYFEEVRAQFIEYPPVQDVYYQERLVSGFMSNFKNIGYVLLGTTALLFMIAMTLIYNTIRLSIHSNRMLIKNMQLIGAAPSFVGKPFFLRSFRNGLISSVIALLVLFGIGVFIRGYLPTELLTESVVMFGVLCGGLLILGVGMNLFSTFLTVNKYLQTNLDELHS